MNYSEKRKDIACYNIIKTLMFSCGQVCCTCLYLEYVEEVENEEN